MTHRRAWLNDAGLSTVQYVGGPTWGTEFAISDGTNLVYVGKDEAEVLVAFLLEHIGQGKDCEEPTFEKDIG